MSFVGLLCNTLSIVHIQYDKWNNPTETTEPAIKCRIEYSNRVVRNFKGEDVLSVARIFFKSDANVTENDKLFFDGRAHGVQKISRLQNYSALHHLEVYVD